MNGKQHGEGKYVLPNGVVRVGVWEYGKRITWLSSSQRAKVDSGELDYRKLMLLEENQ